MNEKAVKNVVVDFGHSGTKAGNGDQNIFLPSVISNDVYVKKDKSFFENFDPLLNLVVEYKDIEYAAGELAIDKGGNHKISDDTSTSDYAEQLIIASLAYLCEDQEEINLLLSLPATHFKNKATVVNRFKGDDIKVGIYDYDLKEMVYKTIKINNLDIKPEGYYITADFILDDQGRIAKDKKDISRGFLVGLDVGYYSTDPYITIDGVYQDDIPKKTIPGLHLVHERLSDIIKTQTNVEKAPYEMEHYIEQGYIKHKGQKIKLKDPTQKLYKFLAQTIADQLKNLLQEKIYEVDVFVLGGGGSAALEQYLKPLFHNPHFLKDPRFVNVRAGLKHAKKVYGG